MRVPMFERYHALMQGAAGFMVGLIVGAIVYHSIFLLNFEAIKNMNGQLEEKLNQYETDIKQLKQFKTQHTVIKSVLPIIEQDLKLDELTQTALKKKLRDNLKVLIGRSIYEIDSDAKMARLLLSGKVYTDIYKKDYTVEIKTMLVVDNVLQVWFKAKVLERPPG
ncbi:hypothetical protein [Paenibacillus spongiae]|uniref:Sporulation membrane protein YtrI C-terminal domain-containing protein n=1 Tax=Paenibacillus spongiae TaxID=2909671 RepID=A0ABY5SGP0_9BACL|nr:hypothetical protein [Paenibacillus spongiae]UVI31887.1 hypothetical protein L1F29_08750 [Paenibacillus spongiae]